MALATIVRKATDIAADKAHDWLATWRAYGGSLLGIGIAKRDFADKQCGRAVTQAEARRVFNGERAIRADFPRLDLQVSAQCVRHRGGSGKGAHRRAADTHDSPAHRLPIKHLVEIDDTIDIGERHAQRVRHFCRNRFGQPAVDTLSGVQSWQERRATLRRQRGKERAHGNQFAISRHPVFQLSMMFHSIVAVSDNGVTVGSNCEALRFDRDGALAPEHSSSQRLSRNI